MRGACSVADACGRLCQEEWGKGEQNKKGKIRKDLNQSLADFYSVRDEIRTHTAFRPLPPQSSVSTNSTTRTFG